MRVTFIVRLMTALIDVLTSKGFEIGDTDVREYAIERLEFSKDAEKYSISISENDDESLTINGSMRKENWCIAESQIGSVLKSRRTGDHVTIVSNGDDKYIVSMTKNFNTEFDMNGVNKNALRAIALDVLGGIMSL